MRTLTIPELDGLDKKLIACLQEDFPLVMRPFKKIAGHLRIAEDEVIERVKRLKAIGIIKRIGSVHDSENLGFKRTLIGMAVPFRKVDKVAGIVNSFVEVTHNYLRQDDTFNLWFTLICPTQRRIGEIIKEIKEKSGINKMVNLPTVRTIKIKTVFKTD